MWPHSVRSAHILQAACAHFATDWPRAPGRRRTRAGGPAEPPTQHGCVNVDFVPLVAVPPPQSWTYKRPAKQLRQPRGANSVASACELSQVRFRRPVASTGLWVSYRSALEASRRPSSEISRPSGDRWPPVLAVKRPTISAVVGASRSPLASQLDSCFAPRLEG